MQSTVEIWIGDDRVVKGYVTNISESYTSGPAKLSVSGSGKCIDLIECSVPIDDSKSYKDMSVQQIAASICKPYDIEVIDEVGKTERINFNFSPEDKITKVLEKIIIRSQLLFSEDENGNLRIVRIGSQPCKDSLEYGKNLKSISRTQNTKNLFSDYVFIGQGANASSTRESDGHKLKEVASLKWRKRTTVVTESGDVTREFLQARAIAVRDHSAASATTYTAVVQGWRQRDGGLWRINSLVELNCSLLGFHERLLISKIRFDLNSKGMTTTMDLVDIEAFIDTNCSYLKDISKSDSKKKEKQINLASIESQAGGEWTMT